jgi:tRNA(Arg) A34 adenosine deaminase TadA
MTSDQDFSYLRRAFDVARRAREGGDHPFGALIVGPDGEVLREQGNGYSAEGGDRTAHAERLLASWAAKTAVHALQLRRALRDVRGRDLLGGNRAGRLRAKREGA